MSGLVDKWTRKISERCQAIFSGSGPSAEVQAGAETPTNFGWMSPALGRIKMAGSVKSEASVVMLVQCFSP
ncbi:hypothetical protein MLD38_027003 [Melastoma candidum]|uniref:Uncharacterized protein n=1 Tax=Melastoma candidum TaxID=119954 RepID=A0ACB9P6J2_9MYRT|nr:hypothetical protein MLD38_027003 [Melastoma candidum]